MARRILLAHGSGGRMSRDLVTRCFLKPFDNPILAQLDDAAVFGIEGERMAFTTDAYVIQPIFFPGGDIGRLAICGTVNDLAMVGAEPRFISFAIIIEEGFPEDDLARIAASARAAADGAGVKIVTGDTKVVPRGAADRLFITTAGIGIIPNGIHIAGSNARIGDRVIISGTIGDHGIAVLSRREGLEFSTPLESDCAPLNHLVTAMLEASPEIHCLRDPTRGGLATTLNEIAVQSGVGIRIEETVIPIRDEVRAACEMLGLDPLYVPSEGRLVAFVAKEQAECVLEAMHRTSHGERAAIIGEVSADRPGTVTMKTRLGTLRTLDMLAGEMMPRIC